MTEPSKRYESPYRRAQHPAEHYFEEDAPVPGWICGDCGCVIANRTIHNQWHDRQDRQEP